MKVCWISNIPSPYKVQLMNLIGKELDLVCIFEKRNEQGREEKWIDENHEFFNSYFLKKIKNDDMNKIIDECDLLINSNYTSLEFMRITKKFKRKNKPVILHADGGLVVPRGLFDKIISLFMKQFDFYLSSGKEVNKYFNYYGIKDDKIFNYRFSSVSHEDLIKNNTYRLKKDEFKQKYGVMGKKVLLSVGQQIPRKGYDILCNSLIGIHKNFELFVVGGTQENITKEICEKNNLNNIHFEGFKSKEDLAEYYAMADIFILPTRYDIWGLVINEAMSFGLPIISTNKCIAAIEFSNICNNAIIVKSDDINNLRNAIDYLIDNDFEIIKLGERSLKTIQNYTIEDTKSDFISIFEKICNKS